MSEKHLIVQIFNDPMYMENGAVVHLRGGRQAWIIDPGLPPQAPRMIEYVRADGLSVEKIVLTHAHADHIAGIDDVRDDLSENERIPVFLAREEWAALRDPQENLSVMSGPGLATEVTDPQDLVPGETLELDGTSWEVRDVSGHSPGGRALYCAELGIVFVGDALFRDSVGRVDFHHSDGARLLKNIRENLLSLPDETRVCSGHGPETSIGRERERNPFLINFPEE